MPKFPSQTYADFKYEMHDITTLYYGARYTYQDLLDDHEADIKIRQIIAEYILKEVEPETTLESHFYYMTPESRSYLVYDQLKTKVRVGHPIFRRKLFGGRERIYEQKIMSLKDLAALSPEEKKKQGIVISEIQISKMGLMTFTV